MRHAAIPIYSDPDQKLSMVVRVDQTYTEYRKEGIFPNRRVAGGGAGRDHL